jgi:uncharacterized membrane protein
MIELIKACLIVNIIVLLILLIFVISMGIWYFKREIKHKEEKSDLKQSRDWHINELRKRSGVEDADLH